MRFAYLILAHRDAVQLAALIERLLKPGREDVVALHVDKRSEIGPGEIAELKRRHGDRLILAARTACYWGHPSLVLAELRLMQSVAGLDYDYAHLISGQDWPLRARERVAAEIRPGTSYLTIAGEEMQHRMNDYYFPNWMAAPTEGLDGAAYYLKKGLARLGRQADALAKRLGRSRTCPFAPAWKKGSQWWSLPKAAIDHLVPRLERLVAGRRLRYTVCSDEHVIQTILAYSPFARNIAADRRFTRWTGAYSPDVLTAAQRAEMLASDAWFARKFDRRVDGFFLDL